MWCICTSVGTMRDQRIARVIVFETFFIDSDSFFEARTYQIEEIGQRKMRMTRASCLIYVQYTYSSQTLFHKHKVMYLDN